VPSEWEYTWPPCENGSFETGGTCYNSLKCFNGNSTPGTEDVEFPSAPEGYEWVSCTVRVEWTSRHPYGWQIGTIRLAEWVTDQYVERQQIGLGNNADAGQPCYVDSAFDVSQPFDPGDWRFILTGQAGQGETDPYPLMVSHVHLTLVADTI